MIIFLSGEILNPAFKNTDVLGFTFISGTVDNSRGSCVVGLKKNLVRGILFLLVKF